jgi:phosphoserine phosphatase
MALMTEHRAFSRPGTLLITITGPDRPGVTSALFSELSTAGVEVLDVEQIVLRGRLILGVLVSAPRDWKKLSTRAQHAASQLGMQITIEPGMGDNQTRGEGRSHVTVIGAPLYAKAVAAVAGRIADLGGNIDRIVRMARYPVTSIEFHVSGVAPQVLRSSLALEAAKVGVDLAVEPASLLRRGMRLIVMDVDSTLIQGEVIEMLAAKAGREAEVAALTGAAMNGEVDFAQSLRERVALLEGLPAAALDEVYHEVKLTKGAKTLIRTLRRLGYRFALVSGGFSQVTDRLAKKLKVDFVLANELEIVEGKLTGRVVGKIVDRAAKAEALRKFAAELGLPLSQTIAIGDGANDLDMLGEAGLGIAYNAKKVVQDAAHTAVNVPYLDAIVYLLGITREEIELADAQEGLVTPAPPVKTLKRQ